MIKINMKQFTWLLLLLLPSFCIFLYWPGIYGPLLLDDLSTIGFLINSTPDLGQSSAKILNQSGPLGRPVAMASFIANALLSQDLFYWKLTNLVIHLIAGLLIFALVRILCTRYFELPKASIIASIVAALWLLHPLQVSTVLYTVQRMTQLATLFTLAGMYFYLLAREWPARSKKFVIYQTLAWLVFFPLAIFCKETALLFPLFVVLLELFIIQAARIDNRTMFYIVSGLATLGLLAFWLKADYFLGGYAFREFTPNERLLTQARVVVTYLGMLLIPAQKRMGFLHDDIELSTGLLEPWTTAPAIVLLAFLLASAFYFRKKQPLYSFGILFFFAGHLLESTIFPLELMYEHRNYLPSVGFFLALAIVADRLIAERRILIPLSVGYLLLLSFTTWLRADTWGSDLRLYYHIEINHPKSERMAFVLASQAANAGAFERAREKLKPFDTLGSQIQRLRIDCLEHKSLADGRLDIDIQPFRVADNFAVMGLVDIANLGLDQQCSFSFESYLSLLDNVLKHTRQMRSNRQMLFMYKAHYQWRLEQKEQAIATLQQGFSVDQKNPTPLFLACEWALDENLKKTADELCPNALRIAETQPHKFDDLAEQLKARLNL